MAAQEAAAADAADAQREAAERRRQEELARIEAEAVDLTATPAPKARPAPEVRSQNLRRAGRGAMVALLLVGAAAAGVGLRLLARDGAGAIATGPEGVQLPAGVDRQPALLLVTADETPATPADSTIILAYDRVERTGTILLIPVSTVADIPGHGVLPLSRSLEFGDAPLTAATVDNLLGISVDGVARMSYQGWATLLGRAGQIPVEVPERITQAAEDGGTQVQFLAGAQSLDGPQSAAYLGARNRGEPELSALPRVQDLLESWLEVLATDEVAFEDAFTGGLPMIDTGMDRADVVDLFRELVAAHEDDRLDVRVLPVRPIGSGAEDGYRPETSRLEELVRDRLSASVPREDRAGRSLQILNGNGAPGIGQDVAARLLPAGFRVVLTGNADDFDHAQTKIVIFDDSPEQFAIAQEIQELLGVGDIEISITPQSVVDITIVVGADFPAS